MHLEDVTIRGMKVSVEVTDNGLFRAFDPESYEIASHERHSQLLQIVDKKLRAHKRVKVAIPFFTHDFKPALATGRHARTRAILIHIDDGTPKGRSDQIYGYSTHKVYKGDLSEKAIKERIKLAELAERLQKRIKLWEDKHSFNLGAAVDEAIRDARASTTQQTS